MEALTASIAVPAVQVVADQSASLSYFGGDPRLPEGVAWPECEGKKLGFIARLSLSQIQTACPISWLPSSGALLFFYDIDAQPWGFDPKDRGSSAVLHVPDLPESVRVDGLSYPREERGLSHRTVQFRRIESRPSWERPVTLALKMTREESNEYFDVITGAFDGKPDHQVGGYPVPVQGDGMELEAHLASQGVHCGDAKKYRSAEAIALAPGAEDWRLLFQVGADDDLGVMWGDCGSLYYWVREQDARQERFENTWLVLQCS